MRTDFSIPAPQSQGQHPDEDLCAAAWIEFGSAPKANAALKAAGYNCSDHWVRKFKSLRDARLRAMRGAASRAPAQEPQESPLLNGLGAAPEDGRVYVRTWDAVAVSLGVDRSRVFLWKKRAHEQGLEGFPDKDPEGWICVDEVAAWREQHVGTDAAGRGGGRDDVSQSLKNEKLKLEVEAKRRDAALEAGDLLHRRDAEETLVQRADALSRAIERIVSEHAGEFVGISSEHEARERLQGVLDTLREVYIDEAQGVAS